jgi:hypothetical protein
MKHPSELFIKFLLVSGYKDDSIKETLKEYGLPPILEEMHDGYLDKLRADILIQSPKNFTLADDSEEAIKFLNSFKIYGLIHPDSSVNACLKILDNPQARMDTFLGLLGKIDETELCTHIGAKFRLDDITPRVIQLLSHYYFDVNTLSTSEWAKIFESMQDGNDSDGYAACLRGGAIVACYRIGIERNVTIKEVVKEAVTALYVSLQEVRGWPASSSKIKVLSDTVSALAKAHVVINTADQELAAVAAELRQFKLARNSSKPLPLSALSNNNYSNSGKPEA